MKHKALWITLAVVAILGISLFSWVKGTYNTMVAQDENVKTAWSQVENQYQRRMDLIPNLVNTVKGYAAHEKETLEGVVSARAQATQTTIDPSNLNEESMKKFQAAQGELSSALSRLMVVLERYPDLKANQNFSELQAQLERKTGYPSNANASTKSHKPTTPISAASLPTYSPACSASNRKPISLPKRVQKKRLR